MKQTPGRAECHGHVREGLSIALVGSNSGQEEKLTPSRDDAVIT